MSKENTITSALSSLEGLDNTKIRILPKIEKIKSDLAIELEKHPLLGDVDYIKKVESLLIMFDTLIDLSEEQIRLLKQALESLNRVNNVEDYAKPNDFYSNANPMRQHLNKLAEMSLKQPPVFDESQGYLQKGNEFIPQMGKRGRPPSNSKRKIIPVKELEDSIEGEDENETNKDIDNEE